MAYDPMQQDPNQQQNQSGQPGMAPPTTSSAPGAGPGASTGKSAATPQSAPTQPFQNLSAYLSANAPQINQQASTIAGNLTNQYGQVQSDINKGQSDFGQQVQSGYATPNADLTNQAAANPSAFVSNPDNVKAFQSLYNDAYTGPENFESSSAYGGLNTEVQKAMNDASGVQSTAGIQNYFQGQNPNATAGGNMLDTVLLQGSPDAYSQVSNAAKPFAGLTDYLGKATTAADTGVTNAQQTAQQTAGNLQNQFTGASGVIPTFQQDVNQRVTSAQQQAGTQEKEVKDLFTNLDKGQFPATADIDKVASDIGISHSDLLDYMSNFNSLKSPQIGGIPVSPLNYLTQQAPTAAINPSNFATQEDYQKAAALSQLTGQDLTSFLNPSNKTQAGTAPANLNNFNFKNAYNDVANQYNELFKQKNPWSTNSIPLKT